LVRQVNVSTLAARLSAKDQGTGRLFADLENGFTRQINNSVDEFALSFRAAMILVGFAADRIVHD
jgi:hypothetical protein